MSDSRWPARVGSVLRRSWPWLLGLAIVVAVVARVPLAALRQALGHGPHLALAIVDLIANILMLGADSIASWVGLIAARVRRPFAAVMAARGATYVLFVINYAAGQGGFGYYLYRTGAAPLRATGATLFLLGTNFATLIVVTTTAWAIRGPDAASATMGWTLVALCGAFVAYLGVIATAPALLARRPLFAPLFEAGLRGHLGAMLGRLPHVAVVVLGLWWAMHVWGIAVPLSVGLTTLPVVVIASALPISPGGLGTTQAMLVYFFSDYVAGATSDDRAASVLAFSLAHFAYVVVASVAIGLVCAPLARRGAAAAPVSPAPTAVDPS